MNPFNLIKDQLVRKRIIDEEFHAMALAEIASGHRRAGLWAKALAQSNGTENGARVAYVRLLTQAIRDDAYIAQRIQEESQEEEKRALAKRRKADVEAAARAKNLQEAAAKKEGHFSAQTASSRRTAEIDAYKELQKSLNVAAKDNGGLGIAISIAGSVLLMFFVIYLAANHVEYTSPPISSNTAYVAPSVSYESDTSFAVARMRLFDRHPELNVAGAHYDKTIATRFETRMQQLRDEGHSDVGALNLAEIELDAKKNTTKTRTNLIRQKTPEVEKRPRDQRPCDERGPMSEVEFEACKRVE